MAKSSPKAQAAKTWPRLRAVSSMSAGVSVLVLVDTRFAIDTIMVVPWLLAIYFTYGAWRYPKLSARQRKILYFANILFWVLVGALLALWLALVWELRNLTF